MHTIHFNGHLGRAAANESFSIEGFAHDVIKYSQENNFTQVVIFGYGMGGSVAMYPPGYYLK